MKRVHSISVIALTAVVGLSAISAPMMASANEQGDRNTALGLGVLAAGLLLTQHNKLPGLLAAGGAAYAYSRYNSDVQARHRWEQGGYSYDYRNRPQQPGYRYGQNSDRNGYNQDNGYSRDNGNRYRQDNNQKYRDDNGNNHGGNNQRRDSR
jgi:hypothetical protein